MNQMQFNRGRKLPEQRGYLFSGAAPFKSQVYAARKVELDINDPALRRNLDQYFNAGRHLMHWYENTFPKLLEFFGGDEHKTALFVDLLASTSPQTTIIENIYRALFYLTALEEGWLNRLTEYFEAHFNNCCRSFCGIPLHGMKVNSFQANLLGDPNAVTVDTWIMRAFGLRDMRKEKEFSAPSRAEYIAVANAARKLAVEYGVTPCQFQAAVWVGVKKLNDIERNTVLPFEDIFYAVKKSLDKQLKLNFDGTVENYQRVGWDEQERFGEAAPEDWEGLAEPIISPGDESVDDRELEYPAFDDPFARAIGFNPKPVYVGQTVAVRLRNLVEYESTIDSSAIEFLFSLQDPVVWMKCFYFLRQYSMQYAGAQDVITADTLDAGMQQFHVKQPISPAIVP